MRVLINRERKGKKQVQAPKSIEVYDGNGDLVATIMFCDDMSDVIMLKNHCGSKIQTTILKSDDGYEPILGHSSYTNWASVGEEQ